MVICETMCIQIAVIMYFLKWNTAFCYNVEIYYKTH